MVEWDLADQDFVLDRHASSSSLAHHVRRPAPTGEGQHHVRLSLRQHLGVADRPSGSALHPIGGELEIVDPVSPRPIARDPVGPAPISLDHDADSVLAVQLVQHAVGVFRVAEIATAADE